MKLYEITLSVSDASADLASLTQWMVQSGIADPKAKCVNGAVLLLYTRTLASLSQAIISAAEEAIAVGLRLESLEPSYLVHASEAAARLGITSAAITKHQKRGVAPQFPAPVCHISGDRPLYDWLDVATWAYRRGKLEWKHVRDASVWREASLLIAMYRSSPRKLVSELKRVLPKLEGGCD